MLPEALSVSLRAALSLVRLWDVRLGDGEVAEDRCEEVGESSNAVAADDWIAIDPSKVVEELGDDSRG